MASGFIKISENNTFAPRWTGYDEILRLIARELKQLEPKEQNLKLSDWIQQHFPTEEEKDPMDPGWAFINKRKNDLTNRSIDLTSLTIEQTTSFWNAAMLAHHKLNSLGSNYSTLNPEFMKSFLEKRIRT